MRILLFIALFLVWTVTHKDSFLPISNKITFNQQELNCLVENIYYEARGESLEGMWAVATVTINRLQHKSFPKTICKVVHQPFQFSWTRQPGRPQMPPETHTGWPGWTAREALRQAHEGGTWDPTGGALWFHSIKISKPHWVSQLQESTTIGQHVFYKEHRE